MEGDQVPMLRLTNRLPSLLRVCPPCVTTTSTQHVPGLQRVCPPCVRTCILLSNMMSISSWLVWILVRGMEMMERLVCWASALMKLVLPVPEGSKGGQGGGGGRGGGPSGYRHCNGFLFSS